MSLRTFRRSWAAATALLLGLLGNGSGAAAPTEAQVKAVFIFNFSRFVAWPEAAFTAANQPFVIGVLGADPFGSLLEDAVHGELAGNHPLIVRHFQDIADVRDCQILFIDRSQGTKLQHILTTLGHRSILTVADLDDASRQGVMIQLATENKQVHLLINAASARAAGLTISSNLMRLADIVGPRTGA